MEKENVLFKPGGIETCWKDCWAFVKKKNLPTLHSQVEALLSDHQKTPEKLVGWKPRGDSTRRSICWFGREKIGAEDDWWSPSSSGVTLPWTTLRHLGLQQDYWGDWLLQALSSLAINHIIKYLIRSEDRVAENSQFILMLVLDCFLVIIQRVDTEYNVETFSLDTFQSLWSRTDVAELLLIPDLMRGPDRDVKTFNNYFAFFRPNIVTLFEVTEATLKVRRIIKKILFLLTAI